MKVAIKVQLILLDAVPRHVIQLTNKIELTDDLPRFITQTYFTSSYYCRSFRPDCSPETILSHPTRSSEKFHLSHDRNHNQRKEQRPKIFLYPKNPLEFCTPFVFPKQVQVVVKKVNGMQK